MSSLKKSSPLLSRLSRPFSTQSVSSRVLSAFRLEQLKPKDYHVSGLLLKSVSAGIVLGSGIGFWAWSSSDSSVSFADWATRKLNRDDGALDRSSSLQDGADESHNKPRKYILADSYRRKIFFNYERRIRMRSPPEKQNNIILLPGD